MAFNWPTFRTRALTALVFVAVMLTGLLWNHWSFFILFSIIHFGCWWEYIKLTEKIQQATFHRYSCFGFMLIGYGIMLAFCNAAFSIDGFSFSNNFAFPVSLAGFILLVVGIFLQKKVNVKAFANAGLGLLYISLSWGLMLSLLMYRSVLHEQGMPGDVLGFPTAFFPILIIISIWINDTMAYIVGSFIGKTPLSSISPKKTWEGTVGGIILSVTVVSLLVSAYLSGHSYKLPFYHWILIPLIASVTGTFGDLLESKLKRMAGVKDSGHIMPGHGGFLDRFDSLLLATPFVWIYVYLFL